MTPRLPEPRARGEPSQRTTQVFQEERLAVTAAQETDMRRAHIRMQQVHVTGHEGIEPSARKMQARVRHGW